MATATLEDLQHWLSDLSRLSKEAQNLSAPYEVQIAALKAQMAQATADLTFQMETLEALIKPAILTLQQTQKVPYMTVVYVKKASWDNEKLLAMAEEIPAIMQACKDASTVQFRKTGR